MSVGKAGVVHRIEDGDTIVVDINTDRVDCLELDDPTESTRRRRAWQAAADANGGSTRT